MTACCCGASASPCPGSWTTGAGERRRRRPKRSCRRCGKAPGASTPWSRSAIGAMPSSMTTPGSRTGVRSGRGRTAAARLGRRARRQAWRGDPARKAELPLPDRGLRPTAGQAWRHRGLDAGRRQPRPAAHPPGDGGPDHVAGGGRARTGGPGVTTENSDEFGRGETREPQPERRVGFRQIGSSGTPILGQHTGHDVERAPASARRRRCPGGRHTG